jgi:autotransporter-associated beta strand protein
MKRILSLLPPLLATALFSSISSTTAEAISTLYWDVNADAPGGGPGIGGFYDGTWGTEPYWSSDPNGAIPTGAWVAGDNAVFSAGNDPAADGFVLINGTQTANSIVIEEGTIHFRGGTADAGFGTVTVNAGAVLDINQTLRLNTNAGKVVLNGGTLFQTNPFQAGSFLGTGLGLKGLEIDGSGTIGYDDGDAIPNSKISIFFGIISGTGGTTNNGGAGTLTKVGPDQIGIGGSNQSGVNSQSLSTFAKLVVKQGGYRGRLLFIDGQPQLDERFLGAVPLSILPDAVTLDGGGIGVNFHTTLHPNRGITIGPGGGYFDHGAGVSLIIPGPLSGAGTLLIGNPNSTLASNDVFTLSNTHNVDTFTGGLVGVRGRLQLNSSLKVASLNDGSTNNATINIGAGQTLTVGTGDGNDSWATVISGPGAFTKVGTGTQALTGSPTYTGDTLVERGTLSIANAYLADGADVYLTTDSTFNLGFTGIDTIRSLYFDNLLQRAGTWGAPGSGAQYTSNLLLGTGQLGPTIGVPEPATFGLVPSGLFVWLAAGRRRPNKYEEQ